MLHLAFPFIKMLKYYFITLTTITYYGIDLFFTLLPFCIKGLLMDTFLFYTLLILSFCIKLLMLIKIFIIYFL